MARKLKGTAAAPGIVIAPLVHFHSDLDFIPTWEVAEKDIPMERERLDEAIASVSRSLLFLSHELSGTLSDHDRRIYDAQQSLLHDRTFKDDLLREIETDKINVEVALQRVIARYEKVFENMQDAAMREKAADVRDVGRQVLGALMEKERSVYISGGKDYIFAADEFLPSDAGILDREHLKGIVTARGGKYSHGAILARSLGIPALVAVSDVLVKAQSGSTVILDGETGQLILDPTQKDLARFKNLIREAESVERRVYEVRFAPAATRDGTQVRLMANVEGDRDLDHVEREVVSGIGLFRTEFAFMERNQFPTEDEQVAMYKRAIDRAEGNVVTFRTLDIGGDKPLRYFRTPEERNPVLGWRGLRISLDWPDIFYTQVRAILRASASGHARILLPMVTNVVEVSRCRKVLEQILEDLAESGEPHDFNIEFGVMIEVPAMVHILPTVLPLVDFVSVGTNDLVQYLLAVDRDNPRVASMYDPYHPAVLRVLKTIGDEATRFGKPASICGEIAGDHYFTPLLIGFGFRELSMAPVFLPRVKLMVRSFSIEECQNLAEKALAKEYPEAVRKLVERQTRVRWKQFLADVVEEKGV
jgi:phosphotransferase system enzyme I (PtsI)